MAKVQILMSTYQGEKYVREQLDSILAQKTCLKGKKFELSILIRDDGSTDHTVSILKEYAKKYQEITCIFGDNVGACKSFFILMKRADKNSDYFAFSDQDDVWNENKIRRALYGLAKYNEIPALYAGDLEIVDQDLKTIRISKNTSKNCLPSFGNALIENLCTGCTIVINQKLYQMVVKKIPSYAYMHDWWLYMTASCFGKVIYDKKPYIQYRQHEDNTVGSFVTYRQILKKRIENFHFLRQYVPKQIREFLQIFDVPEEKRKLANQMLLQRGDYKKRMALLRCREIYRRKRIDTLLYKIAYLFW